jgi:hypothetical protein
MLDNGHHFVADRSELPYEVLAIGVGHDMNGEIDITGEANLGADGNGQPSNEGKVDSKPKQMPRNELDSAPCALSAHSTATR